MRRVTRHVTENIWKSRTCVYLHTESMAKTLWKVYRYNIVGSIKRERSVQRTAMVNGSLVGTKRNKVGCIYVYCYISIYSWIAVCVKSHRTWEREFVGASFVGFTIIEPFSYSGQPKLSLLFNFTRWQVCWCHVPRIKLCNYKKEVEAEGHGRTEKKENVDVIHSVSQWNMKEKRKNERTFILLGISLRSHPSQTPMSGSQRLDSFHYSYNNT